MGAKITFAQKFPLPNPMTGVDNSAGSVTFPNGFKMIWGQNTILANSDWDISVAISFVFKVMAVWNSANVTDYYPPKVSGIDPIITIWNTNAVDLVCDWFAIGR